MMWACTSEEKDKKWKENFTRLTAWKVSTWKSMKMMNTEMNVGLQVLTVVLSGRELFQKNLPPPSSG
jgi:hypothetical protein